MTATHGGAGSDAPLVSVVTPTRNRRPLLVETMDSVARQTFARWEHLIVDDGSDDGTAEEVRARATGDARVRYIPRSVAAAGANVCRNLGLAESRADLVVFLDSDDLLRPDCLERRFAVMQRNLDIDFAVFRAEVFLEHSGDFGQLYHPLDPGDDLLRFLSHECAWQTTGPIWRKAFLNRIGGFDPALPSMQDLELHVRALCAGGRHLTFQSTDHDIRGQADASRTSMQYFSDPTHYEASERLRSKLLEMVRRSGLLTWSRQRAMLGLCFATAERWARSGATARAISVWKRGGRELRAPPGVLIAGMLMLILARGREMPGRLPDRVINKWKGWVRFRQEPALMPEPDEAVSPAAAAPRTAGLDAC